MTAQVRKIWSVERRSIYGRPCEDGVDFSRDMPSPEKFLPMKQANTFLHGSLIDGQFSRLMDRRRG